MALPKDLEDALSDQPKYNPSSYNPSSGVPKLGGNRARRRMLDGGNEEEPAERVSDRHSAEARMMDDILGEHKIGGGRKGGRRRRLSGEGGGSDDDSVASAASSVSNSSAVRPAPRRGLSSKDIGGGVPKNIGVAAPKASPRVRLSQQGAAGGGGDKNMDLLTAMTGRLTRLEVSFGGGGGLGGE